jgi:hypothetical protein
MGLILVCTAKDAYTLQGKQQIDIPNHKIYIVRGGSLTKTILSAYKGQIYRIDDPKKIDNDSIIIFDSQELCFVEQIIENWVFTSLSDEGFVLFHHEK